MTFPANSIIFLSFDFKNKSHFGHYDPLPSIYLSPVVGKGGWAIVFLFLHLLSLFLVSFLFPCVEGGEGAILLQDWFCCGPSIGALWVWYSHVLSFFVVCLLVIWKSFKDFYTA